MTLYDVGPDTVVNPILWKQGVRSMLGVPLITDGRLLGVMHVGTRNLSSSARWRSIRLSGRRSGSPEW